MTEESHPFDGSPFALTSFAIGDLYLRELTGLISSVREVYADRDVCSLLVGVRSQPGMMEVRSVDLKTGKERDKAGFTIPPPYLKVETEPRRQHWLLVSLKAWWLYQLWASTIVWEGPQKRRLAWIDADARLRKPLDLGVPDGEFVGAKFNNIGSVLTGTLLMGGIRFGAVRDALTETRRRCTMRAVAGTADGHQRIFQDVLRDLSTPKVHLPESYVETAYPYKKPSRDAVVEHWQAHYRLIDPSWPPPEEERPSYRE